MERTRCWLRPMRPVTPFMMMPIDFVIAARAPVCAGLFASFAVRTKLISNVHATAHTVTAFRDMLTDMRWRGWICGAVVLCAAAGAQTVAMRPPQRALDEAVGRSGARAVVMDVASGRVLAQSGGGLFFRRVICRDPR